MIYRQHFSELTINFVVVSFGLCIKMQPDRKSLKPNSPFVDLRILFFFCTWYSSHYTWGTVSSWLCFMCTLMILEPLVNTLVPLWMFIEILSTVWILLTVTVLSLKRCIRGVWTWSFWPRQSIFWSSLFTENICFLTGYYLLWIDKLYYSNF